MKSLVLLLVSLSVLFAIFSITVDSATFNCSSSGKCQSLIGYKPTNETTTSAINELFGVESLYSLLAANSLPLSTNPNHIITAGSTIKVPIPCKCGNGTGISDGTPIYTVKKGDSLDYIARTIFLEFVTFQQIQAVNGIENPDKIDIGQNLTIPLPCSCDAVEGATVVHYAHVVAAGSSVDQIAEEFGTTEQTLLSLNNLSNPKDLLAGAILDVPLKACSVLINSTSQDSSLVVPYNSSVLSAHNCVECSCNLTNLQLTCKPSQGASILEWQKCPSMQCEGAGNPLLGNTTSAGCELTTCAYAGYTNDKILTNLTSQSTCASGVAPRLKESRWTWIFLSLNVGLFYFGLNW